MRLRPDAWEEIALSDDEEASASVGSRFVDLAHMAQAVPQVRQMTFGLLILVFLVFKPESLAAHCRLARSWLRVWPCSY